MLKFVNAKINLGLYITGRRPDGYHDLATVFYPVGLYAGLPQNPDQFCDVLEIISDSEPSLLAQISCADGDACSNHLSTPDYSTEHADYYFLGRKIDCPHEKNLVVKGAEAFFEALQDNDLSCEQKCRVQIYLEKHLPDGAGLGGGSADCGILLAALNEWYGYPFSQEELIEIAAGLGADCPFFLINSAAYAEGIGERLHPISVNLRGKWCVIVKPDIYVSTAEAFRGVRILSEPTTLCEDINLPLDQWKGKIHNAFEDTVFEVHPELAVLKERLYEAGAEYASMSGSGSSLFGIFHDRVSADRTAALFADQLVRVIEL